MSMDLRENIDFDALGKEELENLHTEVHALFSQVLSGAVKGFSFKKLYQLHRRISAALINEGGKHIAPIDKLDNIQILEEGGVLDDYSHLDKNRELATINYSGNLIIFC